MLEHHEEGLLCQLSINNGQSNPDSPLTMHVSGNDELKNIGPIEHLVLHIDSSLDIALLNYQAPQ